jgi:hypothetical protein
MATKIRHKRSAVAGKQPLVSQLDSGELAINTADGKVFLLRDDSTVQDITKRIFDNDTEIVVTDQGADNVAEINVRMNGVDTAQFTAAGMNLYNDLDIENAKTLTFKELTAAGDDGVGIKAPDVLDSGYNMTLPPSQGTVGQILATNGSGELFFQDADIFGGNTVYVSQEQGDDANDGQSAPVRTVKRACQIASGLVYNSDGSINFKRVNIKVAVGDYTEQNPIIVPDNTVIKGDGLRGCIIRPANANLDMLRVRNACYFGEFTFRDGVDNNFVPTITADYAVAFDDPFDPAVTDRADYTNLPDTRPTIFTSPYIQNCSIISFLGMNGAKIDGSKVESPNVPTYGIEAENPVIGAIPEQGKSMVANAFTILSFGGTAWRLTNDAYAQIVSCFEIFLLNGVYCQSGGYCSITNSATNFGLYALRASGFSPKAFQFDRSFVTATGSSEGKQTVSIVGINRDAPVEEFVLRFRESEYKKAYELLLSNKDLIASDVVTWINGQISAATPSIWAGFTYNEDKCKRDVQKILDAIRYDILFNSNYRTISAALRYFNGNGTYFLNNQVDQTVAAFAQAKTYTANYLSDATATSRANALWDEVIDIIQNGEGNADAYSYPTPTSGTDNASDTGYLNAATQLTNNTAFIKDEVNSWIADQVSGEIAPFTSSFVYDTAKCARDIGLIIDALIYDLTYGGNLQTYEAALAYFVDGVAQYGSGQLEETVAAYGRLKTVIEQVIVETAVTTSSGTVETQDTTADAGSAGAATTAGDRIQEIIDYLNDSSTLPTRVEPDLTWVNSNPEYSAYAQLDTTGQINIAQNVTQWINEQIQANIWYGFTYDASKCNRDTQLIVEAVAKDTWDTGNRYSRSAGLAYYTRNLQDSSQITISGQELQTIAAIDYAKTEALTYISSLATAVQDFAGSRFDIVTTIINDPNDLPDPTEVSSAGDITNNYKTTPTETTFNAATAVNATTNIITIVGHGFTNGQKVIYDPNGNNVIQGLDDEQQYYVKLLSEDEFTLAFDDSLDFDVNIIATSTGTHKFLSDVIEFFVEEILSSHTTYQTLELESGSEGFEFVPGRAITGTTGANNNSAIVASWTPRDRLLVVSIEEVAVGQSLLRIQFDETSVIDSDHTSGTPNTNIGVNEAAAKLGLGTATFSVTATDGSSALTNLSNLPETQCWFHRPSVVNSSAHTWEYAGSGTDYNALPQNGGNTRAEYEQFEELPGRVYSSGTNELGDFKVGDFITAFNRTGNITFRNKVQVDELDALRLSLSDVAIEEISTSVNLGDDEIGGPSNSRLPTQLAVRSFISNRLGGFVDKTVSTAAVPGAIVQLNVNGQLNPDLIPATRQFTNTNTNGYQSRLEQVDDIPAIDLKAGDIATENYEQVELALSGNINANDGDEITQPGVAGAVAYAKGNYSLSGNILVVTQGGAWDDNEDSTGDPWEVSAGNLFVNGVDSGVNISSKGPSTEIVDNWFLRSSNTSQFLVLDPTQTYTFTTDDTCSLTFAERNSDIATVTTSAAHNLQVGNTVQILNTTDETFNENGLVLSVPSSTTFTYTNVDSADPTKASAAATGTVRTIVTSADGNAQGAVTEFRSGIAVNVDNANIVGGSGYQPILGTQVYESVPLQPKTGSGTGATANLTITAGQVTDVDVNRGGTGYAVGDLLEINASDVGGTGSGFEIEVTAIEKRAYVNILGGELFVASASSLDFVEDNTAVATAKEINLDDVITHNFLAGDVSGGGNVNYTTYRITIANHGYKNGDPVFYDTLGNVPIGGLLNEQVYYVKRIDANTIELYEGFALLNQVEFTSTPANNNHNITRQTVNITDNSIIVENHGLTTGDAIRIESLTDGSSANELFSTVGAGGAVDSGSRFFVGSVTTNSFTIHALRSDALSSINDLVTNAQDITAIGVGTAEVIINNVQVETVINTSSRLLANWNTLAVTNIDAENIISGTISPSRLASAGTPNTDTFLRGDSSYQTVVQSIKVANTTDNPITLTGSSLSGEFYGDPVNIGIANADYDPLGTFSSLGVSRFLQSQFDVDAGGSGQVFIKDGVVDAGTLDSLDSAYFLNPNNLTSLVPVTRGGTGIGTYTIGALLYAQSTSTLNELEIGRQNTFLRSNGTTPEWGTALDLAEGLDVGSAALTSSSTGAGRVYNANVTSLKIGGDATNITIGSAAGSRNLFTFIASYEATISRDVAVNLESIVANTAEAAGNGDKEIIISDTTGILAGMIVTGSVAIPANTTVSGVTDDAIYLSNPTTGSILTSTALTFTYTPYTLGISVGDRINIASSGVSNLDGTWPVSGATANATSFTIRTDDLVTADPLDVPAGSATINGNLVLRNESIVIGQAETDTAPNDGIIKGVNGLGTDVSGGDLTIQAGLGTGAATGGDVIIKTGDVGSTGDIQNDAQVRMRFNAGGVTEVTGYTNFSTDGAINFPVGNTAARTSPPAAGDARFNSEIVAFEGYDGTNWAPLGGVIDVDQDTKIIAETSAGADNDDLDFYTAGVQRLSIDQDGDFRFGASINKVIMDGATGDTNIAGTLTVEGDFVVNGTTTTINATTLTVDDKNIELGSVASPTDATANGGGITLKGATDHTMTWSNANGSWDFSEHVNIISNKEYRIADTKVLDATSLGANIVDSSLVTSALTTVGALDSGSITSGFGNINIGTNTFTGNGSGLTTLNASQLTTGTVAGARLGGNQTMAGVKTFSNTSSATSTTTGAVRISGGLGVAGALFAGSLNTADGSGIGNLNASNLDSGTVPNGRITGIYSNLTGTGALNQGSITSGFGNINIGTSTFTGNGSGLTNVDAETLDGLDSTAFLQRTGGTMTGNITFSDDQEGIVWTRNTDGASIRFYNTSDGDTNSRLEFNINDNTNEDFRFTYTTGGTTTELLRMLPDGGQNGITFRGNKVWHAGNDGPGSGLNADLFDNLGSGSFIRSDANDSFSGTLSGSGAINISGNITANVFTGDGSGLTGISADNANTLDGLDSTQFLRSDATDIMTGCLVFRGQVDNYDGNDRSSYWDYDNKVAAAFEPAANDGAVAILFKSVGNSPSDFAYIVYDEDYPEAGVSAGEIGCLLLSSQNDGTGSSDHVRVKSRLVVEADISSSDPTNAFQVKATNTTTDLFRVARGGGVFSSGEVTAYSSDARLKTNISPITNAIEKVKRLNGVNYDWVENIEELGFNPKIKYNDAGVLAQEVQKVLPQAVAPAPFDVSVNPSTGEETSKSGEEYLTVKYEKMVPLLIEAIKEQQNEIDELKEMVKKLLDK